jgi:hypothetical protein
VYPSFGFTPCRINLPYRALFIDSGISYHFDGALRPERLGFHSHEQSATGHAERPLCPSDTSGYSLVRD